MSGTCHKSHSANEISVVKGECDGEHKAGFDGCSGGNAGFERLRVCFNEHIEIREGGADYLQDR